jgi:hypothetical protein
LHLSIFESESVYLCLPCTLSLDADTAGPTLKRASSEKPALEKSVSFSDNLSRTNSLRLGADDDDDEAKASSHTGDSLASDGDQGHNTTLDSQTSVQSNASTSSDRNELRQRRLRHFSGSDK